MDWFWAALGIVILAAALIDIFLTSLNYDEAGFIATPLCELQWRILRSITRRLPRHGRPLVLRQVTGLQIITCLLIWLVFVAVGYGLIYYGAMVGGSFAYANNLSAGLFSALYFSTAQLATVGTSQVTPQTDVLRTLSILETLTGVVLVTLTLTFLFGVYQVVRALSALSSNFFNVGGVDDPIAVLATYFPQGQPSGVDSLLQAVSGTFASYVDGVRLHHLAYYFQSGRDHFSLPFALDMLAGIIAALRWGLPANHPAAQQPLLMPLTFQFTRFASYLHTRLHWTSPDAPEVAAYETFAVAYRAGGAPADFWLDRFLRLNRAMGQVARLEPVADPRPAFARYQQWLPFAFNAQQAVAAVSRDLDYRPILRHEDSPSAAFDESLDSGGRERRTTHTRPGLARRLRTSVERWVAAADPGLSRLTSAARAALAAGSAVAMLFLLLTAVGAPAMEPAMLGGMAGMQAAMLVRDRTSGGRKLTTVLMVLPAIGGVALGAATASSFLLAASVLIVVVLGGVWVRRFGPRFFALGQLAFMSYYFALLLRFPLDLLPWLALAAVVGMACAYLFHFVLLPERPVWALRHGLAAFHTCLATLLDPLIDAVAAARWDPDIEHHVRGDLERLERCGRFLEGELQAIDPAGLGMQIEPGELRLRLFDAELMARNTTLAAYGAASTGAPMPRIVRARLAGLLDAAQGEVARAGTPAAATSGVAQQDEPQGLEGWPEPARRLHAAVGRLLLAVMSFQAAPPGTLAEARVAVQQIEPPGGDERSGPRSQTTAKPAQGDHARMALSTRQAIQAAVATGLSVFAGAAISSSREYWAAIAAFVIISGTQTVGQASAKGLQRIVGTLAGAIVGFSVARLTGANATVIIPLLLVCVFVAMYELPVSYSQMVFWVTMMLALLYELLGELSVATLGLRVLETLAGAIIAIAIAMVLLPTRTQDAVKTDILASLRAVNEITEACLGRIAGRSPERNLADLAQTLNQRLRQVYDSAGPLRSAPGAFARDGIERQLTGLLALAYYSRELINATAPAQRATLSESMLVLNDVAQAVMSNLSGLARIVDGQGPEQAHEIEDALSELNSPNEEQAPPAAWNRQRTLSALVRMNQTLVALIHDLSRERPNLPVGQA